MPSFHLPPQMENGDDCHKVDVNEVNAFFSEEHDSIAQRVSASFSCGNLCW